MTNEETKAELKRLCIATGMHVYLRGGEDEADGVFACADEEWAWPHKNVPMGTFWGATQEEALAKLSAALEAAR